MNISGYQDFLNKFGNDNISEFNNLRNCYGILQKICNCQKQRKAGKAEECNNIYINTIKSLPETIREYFVTKTNDSEIVFYHNGSHEIKRIKLR